MLRLFQRVKIKIFVHRLGFRFRAWYLCHRAFYAINKIARISTGRPKIKAMNKTTEVKVIIFFIKYKKRIKLCFCIVRVIPISFSCFSYSTLIMLDNVLRNEVFHEVFRVFLPTSFLLPRNL